MFLCFNLILPRHVIVEKVPIDVHALITLLEIVTALAVVGSKPHLHGLLIPSSWLFMLGQQFRHFSRDIWAYASFLINPLKDLASLIHSGAGKWFILVETTC